MPLDTWEYVSKAFDISYPDVLRFWNLKIAEQLCYAVLFARVGTKGNWGAGTKDCQLVVFTLDS